MYVIKKNKHGKYEEKLESVWEKERKFKKNVEGNVRTAIVVFISIRVYK